MTALLWVITIALFILGIVLAAVNLSARGRHADEHPSPAPALACFGVAVIVLVLAASFVSVDAGEIGVVTKFGKVVGTLEPGAHLIAPFVESVNPVSVRTHVVKPSEEASSNDLQVVHTEVTLAYHLDPQHVDYIYSQLMDSSDHPVENKVIIPAILEAIKATTAQYSASDLIAKRAQVRDGIDAFVTQRLAPYHIIAESVSITDFHFSQDYENAIERKVTAIQDAERAQNELNKVKIEAEQKIAAAEGEAKALAVQREQITPELLQLRTIEMMKEKWDGQLPNVIVGGNGALPMMDVLQAARAAQANRGK